MLTLLGLAHFLIESLGSGFWRGLCHRNAEVAAMALSLVGEKAVAEGAVVVSDAVRLEVIRECTAIYPVAILFAAVLAFPSSLRAKVVGLAVCVPIVAIVNTTRIVSMYYVVRVAPHAFEVVHMVVWQSLIVVITVLLFLAWAGRLPSHAV